MHEQRHAPPPKHAHKHVHVYTYSRPRGKEIFNFGEKREKITLINRDNLMLRRVFSSLGSVDIFIGINGEGRGYWIEKVLANAVHKRNIRLNAVYERTKTINAVYKRIIRL